MDTLLGFIHRIEAAVCCGCLVFLKKKAGAKNSGEEPVPVEANSIGDDDAEYMAQHYRRRGTIDETTLQRPE